MAQNDKRITDLEETRFIHNDDFAIINHENKTKKIRLKNLHKNVITLDDISNIPQIDPDQIEPGAKLQILVTQGDKIYRIESTSVETKEQIGPTGPTGPKGDPGINIIGSGNTGILDPNYHGNIGDAQIITTENGETKIYIWNGTEWEELEIKGVTGPTGPMGPLGLQGPLGPKGDPGVNITGTVDSVEDLDPNYHGNIGDAIIVTNPDGSTKLYIWNGTEWTELEMKGVTGPKGEPGEKGLDGTTSYTNLNKVKNPVGGIQVGTSFNNIKLTKILDNMFYGDTSSNDVNNPIYGDMADPNNPEQVASSFTYYFGVIGNIEADSLANMSKYRLGEILDSNSENLIKFENRIDFRQSYSFDKNLSDYNMWYGIIIPKNNIKHGIDAYCWLTLDNISNKYNLEKSEEKYLILNDTEYYISAFRNECALPVKFVTIEEMNKLI